MCSIDFDEYCSKHDIRHKKTIPHTLQHNGVAKRMNRTLTERVRSMLSSANLPKSFWGETFCITCYLIDRSLPRALECDIPQRM